MKNVNKEIQQLWESLKPQDREFLEKRFKEEKLAPLLRGIGASQEFLDCFYKTFTAYDILNIESGSTEEYNYLFLQINSNENVQFQIGIKKKDLPPEKSEGKDDITLQLYEQSESLRFNKDKPLQISEVMAFIKGTIKINEILASFSKEAKLEHIMNIGKLSTEEEINTYLNEKLKPSIVINHFKD